jgi:hypothetical protein
VDTLDDRRGGAGEGELAGDGGQVLLDERGQGRFGLADLVQGALPAAGGDGLVGADDVFRFDEHAVGLHAGVPPGASRRVAAPGGVRRFPPAVIR